MKSKSLFLLMLFSLFIASCSKDEDNDNDADAVADTYICYSSTTFKYVTTPMITNNDTVTIVSSADNMVNVTLKSTTWGKMTVSNAVVTLANDNYSLKGKGTIVMGMNGSAPKNYECTFTGTVSSNTKEPIFTVSIPSVMGGIIMTLKKGTAPSA